MRLGVKYDGRRYGGYECSSYSIKITKAKGTKVSIDFEMDGFIQEGGFLEFDQEAGRGLAHALLSAADSKTENAQISTTLTEERETRVKRVA
jgi:hypothetical protein